VNGRPGPAVVIWKMRVYDKANRAKPFLVRWRVGNRPHARAFQLKAQAESYELDLRVAARDGLRFSEATGVPDEWSYEQLTLDSAVCLQMYRQNGQLRRLSRNLGSVTSSNSSKNTSTGAPITTSARSSAGRSLTIRIPFTSSTVTTA
jgi:hypothetical protein